MQPSGPVPQIWLSYRPARLGSLGSLHRKKKGREFPVPSRDVTAKLSLDGNNDVITELFLPRGSLVSDIPAGDGKLVNLFLRCKSFTNTGSELSVSNLHVLFLNF